MRKSQLESLQSHDINEPKNKSKENKHSLLRRISAVAGALALSACGVNGTSAESESPATSQKTVTQEASPTQNETASMHAEDEPPQISESEFEDELSQNPEQPTNEDGDVVWDVQPEEVMGENGEFSYTPETNEIRQKEREYLAKLPEDFKYRYDPMSNIEDKRTWSDEEYHERYGKDNQWYELREFLDMSPKYDSDELATEILDTSIFSESAANGKIGFQIVDRMNVWLEQEIDLKEKNNLYRPVSEIFNDEGEEISYDSAFRYYNGFEQGSALKWGSYNVDIEIHRYLDAAEADGDHINKIRVDYPGVTDAGGLETHFNMNDGFDYEDIETQGMYDGSSLRVVVNEGMPSERVDVIFLPATYIKSMTKDSALLYSFEGY